jgi:FMN reductase
MTAGLIVGIGGTQRAGSSSEAAMRVALDEAARAGFQVRAFCAEHLDLPLYDPGEVVRQPAAAELVEAVRAADGVILSSPGYHGTISGMVKNAIDYIEDLAKDERRVYLDGLPVGCIAVAYGWQAAVNTLTALRDVAHALRGMPTPYGAAINASGSVFAGGQCTDDGVRTSLEMVGRQVAHLALRLRGPTVAAPADATV